MVAAVLLGVSVATTPKAKAANLTWNQTGAGPYNWTDSANWGGSGFPNAIGDIATLGGELAGAQTVNLNAVITVGELNFGATLPSSAAGYTLAAVANGLLLLDDTDGAVSINKLLGSPTLDVISAPIQFNDNLTISNNAGGGTLTLSGGLRSVASGVTLTGTGPVSAGSIVISTGAISTAGDLVKSGSGVVTLGVANLYAGSTAIDGGTLKLTTSAAALPSRSAVTLASGAVLDYNVTNTVIGSLAGAGDVVNVGGVAILQVGRNDTSTAFSGRFLPTTAASIAITKIGAGTLTLNPSQASTYTGNTLSLIHI